MKRLITEAELRRLGRGARVAVERGTLVTPAARDYALVMGIELAEASPVPAPGLASAAASGCCESCKSSRAGSGCGAIPIASLALGEGDWLVEVRRGQAVARRIAP
jgi:hypothetical protein